MCIRDSDKGGQSLEELVESGQLDIGLDLRCKDRSQFQFASGDMIVTETPRSQAAYTFLKREFELVNTLMFRQIVKAARQPADFALDFQPKTFKSTAAVQKKGGVSIGTLMPLILVLMTITGAVYPAIDLTAGERERGTLETLMAAPVPRMSILLSKFIAVLVVAVMTATLNIVGMLSLIHI